jgi:hypothetical protein
MQTKLLSVASGIHNLIPEDEAAIGRPQERESNVQRCFHRVRALQHPVRPPVRGDRPPTAGLRRDDDSQRRHPPLRRLTFPSGRSSLRFRWLEMAPNLRGPFFPIFFGAFPGGLPGTSEAVAISCLRRIARAKRAKTNLLPPSRGRTMTAHHTCSKIDLACWNMIYHNSNCSAQRPMRRIQEARFGRKR